MGRRIAFTAILIGALAVSACSTSLPSDQQPPDDPFKAARQSDNAPDGFHDEVLRKACGQVTLDQSEQISTDAVECMDTAIGTLDAELAVVFPTTEGDPIVAFYRTSAGSPGVEKYTDSEFDRYGPKTWTHEKCTEATTLTALQGCSGNSSGRSPAERHGPRKPFPVVASDVPRMPFTDQFQTQPGLELVVQHG